jgi:hypothetical protein
MSDQDGRASGVAASTMLERLVREGHPAVRPLYNALMAEGLEPVVALIRLDSKPDPEPYLRWVEPWDERNGPSPARRYAVVYLNRDTACFARKRQQSRLEGLPGILRVDAKQTCFPLETAEDVRNIMTAVRIVRAAR